MAPDCKKAVRHAGGEQSQRELGVVAGGQLAMRSADA